MHSSAISMRAFTKGRAAFDSDEEYRAALRGELDGLGVHEDFGYEPGSPEDPDDGENLTDEEAVKAELEYFEECIGGTHFLEVLERFMKACSGCEAPPSLPFGPVRGVEHLALFCHGSEALRLRYGAYGFEADRMDGDEVVQTWRGLGADRVLDDWDDALTELAEEAELEKESLEDERKDKFFEDTLPGVLADRKRGAAFLDFVTKEDDAASELHFKLSESESERLWLVRDRAKYEFRLERPGEDGILAMWEEDEFLERLREVAWDDPDAGDFLLGGGDVKGAWEALDDLWYDEEDDGLVVETVDGFLDNVRRSREQGSARARVDASVTGGTGYGDAGRVDMTLEWSVLVPDTARLTVSKWSTAVDKDAGSFLVPLAFLRWWKMGRDR